jgi:hypothetical protein
VNRRSHARAVLVGLARILLFIPVMLLTLLLALPIVILVMLPLMLYLSLPTLAALMTGNLVGLVNPAAGNRMLRWGDRRLLAGGWADSAIDVALDIVTWPASKVLG